jgi:hypothetical protein
MSPHNHNDKEYKARELIDQALLDWHYYEHKVPSNQRYNPSIGKYIDKSYFLDNLYKCHFHSTGCMFRAKTPEETAKHRWIHGC